MFSFDNLIKYNLSSHRLNSIMARIISLDFLNPKPIFKEVEYSAEKTAQFDKRIDKYIKLHYGVSITKLEHDMFPDLLQSHCCFLGNKCLTSREFCYNKHPYDIQCHYGVRCPSLRGGRKNYVCNFKHF